MAMPLGNMLGPGNQIEENVDEEDASPFMQKYNNRRQGFGEQIDYDRDNDFDELDDFVDIPEVNVEQVSGQQQIEEEDFDGPIYGMVRMASIVPYGHGSVV